MNLKKPKFWDYNYPNIFAYILTPVAFLIRLLSLLKSKSKNKKTKIKTICIGNFYIGGTGKTSLSIKINEILKKNKIKSCFVKKYYKNQIDEQRLLENNGKLFLSSKRIDGIFEAQNENYDVAILDDGLQDYSIDYDLSFVCFNTINWIGNGLTIPAGPLREQVSNLKNYKHVFLNGNEKNVEILKKEVLKFNSKINIHIGVYEPTNLSEFNNNEKYLIFSGIGNHQTFVSMLKDFGLNICKDLEFPDHYNYTKKDISRILKEAGDFSAKIITTEKDYKRLEKNNITEIKFIKSELKIIDEANFIKTILN